MKFASIKEAEKIIRETKEKELTSYYGQTFSTSLPQYLSFAEMKEMFRGKGFGGAESNLFWPAWLKPDVNSRSEKGEHYEAENYICTDHGGRQPGRLFLLEKQQ